MQDREYGIKPTHESRVYLGIWEKVKGLKYYSLKASVTGCPVLGLLRVMCSKFNWEMSQVAMTLWKISNAEAWNSSHMWWVLSRCAKLQMQRTTLSQPSQFPCLCHMPPKNGQRMYVATHICEKLVRIYWCRENMCQQWKDSSLVQSDYWPINKFWAQHSVLCVRKKANQTLRAKINILIFFKFLIYRTAKRILST